MKSPGARCKFMVNAPHVSPSNRLVWDGVKRGADKVRRFQRRKMVPACDDASLPGSTCRRFTAIPKE